MNHWVGTRSTASGISRIKSSDTVERVPTGFVGRVHSLSRMHWSHELPLTRPGGHLSHELFAASLRSPEDRRRYNTMGCRVGCPQPIQSRNPEPVHGPNAFQKEKAAPSAEERESGIPHNAGASG